MTSVNQNFTIYGGNTNSVSIGVTLDAGTSSASLGSCSAVWIVENEVESGSLIRLTTDSGISLSGSIATLAISPSLTSGLSGKYYHELVVTDAASNVSTVTTGIVTIKKSGVS